ncbi:sucrase ferredoxin [Pseudonocardia sp.]|uniref:sucrase ferredoxin n=1 Tax=Pseudonocardia sp. TaxID=60912 RepID=UPI003D0D5FE0
MDAEPAPAVRCAVLARALEEPLAGTAPVARRWLCVEHPGAWPRRVSQHPDPALRHLAEQALAAGWRPLLIRRPGRRPRASGPLTVLLADTDPADPRVSRLVLPPGRLGSLRLPGPEEPLPGTPVRDPLLLICTHGRRDVCCALDGRALVTSVLAGNPEMAPNVWESSHLGGHRFAPTALVLPTGYLYGRLDPATAVDVVKAAAHGEMEPLLCRGRSTWPPEGQVAEIAVRKATGLREAVAVRVEECTTTVPATVPPGHAAAPTVGMSQVLVSAADGRRWLVDVVQVAPDRTRPPSCGADPTPVARLRPGVVRLLPTVAS